MSLLIATDIIRYLGDFVTIDIELVYGIVKAGLTTRLDSIV